MTTQTNAPSQPNTEPQTRLEVLELEVAQLMASEYEAIAPLFATDPSEATKQITQLGHKARQQAQANLDIEQAAEQVKITERASAVVAVRGQLTPDFQQWFTEKAQEHCAKLPHVERWSFFVEKDLEKSTARNTVYKEATVVDGVPKQIRTGATRDTTNGTVGGGANKLVITAGPNAAYIKEYPSASAAKTEVLGSSQSMNRTTIVSKLVAEGYTVS